MGYRGTAGSVDFRDTQGFLVRAGTLDLVGTQDSAAIPHNSQAIRDIVDCQDIPGFLDQVVILDSVVYLDTADSADYLVIPASVVFPDTAGSVAYQVILASVELILGHPVTLVFAG